MKKKKYSHRQIQHLDSVDAIRLRPSMFIDDTSFHGLHQLLKEIVDNVKDEFVDGHVSRLVVTIDTKEQIAEVRDNGRGIPIEVMKKEGISALTAIFTLSHTGGKFGKGAYTSATSGLHGIGNKAVAALSDHLQVWTHWKNQVWTQTFERGVAVTPVVIDPKKKLKRGTIVRFHPDRAIFKDPKVKFDPKQILVWLEDASYLCPGLQVVAHVDDHPPVVFKSEQGLGDMLAKETKDLETLHKPLLLHTELFDLALVWTKETEGEKWKSFVNTSPTAQHGTHVEGVKKALQRMFKGSTGSKKDRLRGEDLRDGLVAVLNAKIVNPEFKGQTKSRLGNAEVLDIICSACIGPFKQFATNNPQVLKQLVGKAASLRDARQQFRAKQQAIKGVKVTKGARGLMPEKLCEAPDCDSSVRELFLVEGDSAGGPVKHGRLRIATKTKGAVHFQEVLPLRGKTLNVVRKDDLDKILNNKEIKAIVQAIGAGIGDDFDLRKCRYRGVYLLADADPDGKHIISLLLAFFARHLPGLIEAGRLFIVLNPLFRGVSAKKCAYGASVEAVKKKLGRTSNIRITRYKGLGESGPMDLRYYALDPNTRRTMKVVWGGTKDQKLTIKYMDKDVAIRKKLMELVE